MKEIALGLVLWLNQNTAFHHPDGQPLPEIRQMPQAELIQKLLGQSVPTHLTRAQVESFEDSIAAVYYAPENAILLGDYVDVQTIKGRSALLHELVHFVQFRDGENEKAACLAELEKDAYEVQASYLREHGLEPEFDAFTVAVRSACWDG